MDYSIREHIEFLLIHKQYKELLDICEKNKRYWKVLRLIPNGDNGNLIWFAVEAIALLMQRWWRAGKTGEVREYIRRQFWSLNDESGGIGWNSTQIIAETIIQIPDLTEPYATMIIDRTLDEPLLINSGLWSVGRLGKRISQSIDLFHDKVLKALKGDDPETLGLAAWATGEVTFQPALPYLKNLYGREEKVRIYVNGEFHTKTLGRWAKEAISKITGTP